MKKYPDISCDIERKKFKDDIKGAFVERLVIEQDNEKVKIKRTFFDPTKDDEIKEEKKAKILAFNNFFQVVKFKFEDDSIFWYDYKNKSFDVKRFESILFFKINKLNLHLKDLNNLIKFFDISLSMTSLDNYSFAFPAENKQINDCTVFQSNKDKGFSVKATCDKNKNFKKIIMELVVPESTIYNVYLKADIENGKKSYLKLMCMKEISKLIFKRIKKHFKDSDFIEIL